jgi:hypothetical protein
MPKTPVLFIASLFAVIGTILLIVAIGALITTRSFMKTAIQAEGSVVALSDRSSSGKLGGVYYPVFTFKDKYEHEFTIISSSGSNPAAFSVGEKVTVLYDPLIPVRARIKSFGQSWLFPTVFGGIGLLFAGMGYSLLSRCAAKAIGRKRLLSRGMIIDSIFQEASLDMRTKVNGRSPFVIFSQWQNPDDGKMYTFRSKGVWFNPSKYVSKDQPVKVYIDPVQPKNYYVDISFLPKSAN